MQFALVLPKTYRTYLALALLCVVITTIGFYLRESYNINMPFAYSRNELLQGEYFRILSGHLTHSNLNHLLFNLIGLLLIWLLHGDYGQKANIFIRTILLCIGITFCVYYFSPQLHYYVGFSGVLHGLFAWGVMIDIRLKRKSGYLLLIGLLLKLAQERYFSDNGMMEDLIGLPVAIDAHLYGACIGLLIAALDWRRFKTD